MWPAAAARSINYGLTPEMGGMLGLRDLFVVAAPSSSFHNHHHHHHHDPSAVADPANQAATALGVGVIPLLTATPPCIENELMTTNRSGGGRGIQLWQQEQDSDEQGQYLKKQGSATATTTTAPMFELNEDFVQNENSLSVSGGGGTTTCQDCGNQAKKDCSYRRCRTCCKSRNYDCPTHVRSTWVPEARRRERRLMAAAAGGGGSSGATSGGSKKPRLVTSHQQQQTATTSHTSTSNTTPPRSFDTSSSHQDAGFKEHLPGQVRAPAVFKCVRVTAVDDGQDEIAYQAVVKIGGHVFKGFLYDQGVESGRDHVYPNLSELHLGGGTGSSGGGGDGRNGASSSSPMLDPSDVYAGGGGLLGGSSYGNPIN